MAGVHEDFGEKIGGAKKDLWKDRGLYADDLEAMNYFMNRMTNATFSYFDVGGDGYQQPE